MAAIVSGALRSVPVPMMQIGEMWVAMDTVGMRVGMRMRSRGHLAWQVVVVVMAIVVPMAMRMNQRFMDMIMLMPLGEMQPDAHSHQRASNS